ncbi:MAG: glycoside hydrolase family 5 protein [Rhabdaerophilum sp.]
MPLTLRAFLLALACLGSLLVPGLAGAASPDNDRIEVRGRDLVRPSGEVFLIRGIGLGNWLVPEGYMFKFKKARSPTEIARLFALAIGEEESARFWTRFRENYITEEDVAFLAKAGFNTLRVPLHYRLFMPEAQTVRGNEPLIFEGPGWALLDRFIGWCRKYGLKVILDAHAAPGGQTGINHDDGTGFPLMFYIPREGRRTIAWWEEFARRYKGDPTILGFELLNEPISTYHDEDRLNWLLEPFYKEAVAAIRKIDPQRVIILAGSQWDQNLKIFGPPFAPNLVYVYHQFWSSTRRDAIEDYIHFSMKNNAPVFLGEAGEFNNRWNEAYRLLNERHGFGWSYWTYKNLDSRSTIASIRQPEGWAKMAALGSMPVPDLARAGLTREEARRILDAYLEAMLFRNVEIRPCYLRSLGLSPELESACAAERQAGRGD